MRLAGTVVCSTELAAKPHGFYGLQAIFRNAPVHRLKGAQVSALSSSRPDAKSFGKFFVERLMEFSVVLGLALSIRQIVEIVTPAHGMAAKLSRPHCNLPFAAA